MIVEAYGETNAATNKDWNTHQPRIHTFWGASPSEVVASPCYPRSKKNWGDIVEPTIILLLELCHYTGYRSEVILEEVETIYRLVDKVGGNSTDYQQQSRSNGKRQAPRAGVPIQGQDKEAEQHTSVLQILATVNIPLLGFHCFTQQAVIDNLLFIELFFKDGKLIAQFLEILFFHSFLLFKLFFDSIEFYTHVLCRDSHDGANLIVAHTFEPHHDQSSIDQAQLSDALM